MVLHQIRTSLPINLIGVGVFGLAFKGDHDSEGHSFNFFKSLSSNLYEEAESILRALRNLFKFNALWKEKMSLTWYL